MRATRVAVLLIAALLAACASWRWSGYTPPGPKPAATAAVPDESGRLAPVQTTAAADAPALQVSTSPRAELPPVVVPPTPKTRYRTALFYSDMGPDAVYVSAYPAQQRYNYGVFARSCASCHTLARAINAPVVGRGWWEFYILGMRARSRWQGEPLSKDDVNAILDFLEYDSRVRKVEHQREFEQLTDELKRRFDASLAQRLHDLQKANPRPLTPPKP